MRFQNRARILAISAILAGCTGAAEDRSGDGFSPADKPAAVATDAGSSREAAAFVVAPERNESRRGEDNAIAEVVVAFNGGATELHRGVPAVIEVAVFPMANVSAETSFSLSPNDKDWSSVLKWDVRDDREETHDWKFGLAVPAQPLLAASPLAPITLGAWLAPEETQRIKPGTYHVAVIVEGRLSAIDQNSVALRSETVVVRVHDAPEDPSADDESTLYQIWAVYWRLRDDLPRALATIDERLARVPDDVPLLALKSEFLADGDDVEAALEACREAVDAYLKKHGPRGRPPVDLLVRQRRLLHQWLDRLPSKQTDQAAAEATTPLTEDELVKLVELDIGDEAILAKIGKDGVRMQVDEALRKRLSAAGASKAVIAAVESATRKSDVKKDITVDNLLTLLRLDISSDAILARLKREDRRPQLTSEQLQALRNAGASEQLLEYLAGWKQEK
jgi:hypothetical protein